MRYIFIVLFLISFGSVSMGGIGDVYYCISDQHLFVSKNSIGQRNQLNFSFRLTEEKLIFEKDSYFKITNNEIVSKGNIKNHGLQVYGKGVNSIFQINEKQFSYTNQNFATGTIVNLIATCSIFN